MTTLQKKARGPGSIDQNSSKIQARTFLAKSLVKYVGSSSTKGKQHWANEKPKVDNARKLRGIYYIDPDVLEFKDTMNNARKKSTHCSSGRRIQTSEVDDTGVLGKVRDQDAGDRRSRISENAAPDPQQNGTMEFLGALGRGRSAPCERRGQSFWTRRCRSSPNARSSGQGAPTQVGARRDHLFPCCRGEAELLVP